jgi:Cu(I)/Ag(I) efflux system membrane fusion protein
MFPRVMATVTVMETEKKDKRMSRRARTITLAALVAAAFIAGYLIRGRSEAPPVSDKQGHQAVAEVWTCSMHPQIRMPGPGKCPICFMDLIPVEQLAGEDLGDRRLAMSESAIKLAEIETSPVSRRPAAAVIRSVGSVAFDETRISEITAWVPGRIEKLLVNFTGAVVRRGDPLAEIYSPALVIAQEELVQAKRSSDAAPGDAAAAAMLDAAREKLRQYGMTAGQIEAVETEGKASRSVVTHAPSSGVVVDLAAKEGQYLKTGAVLMKIADLSKVWVTLRAFQSDLPLVRPGQEVVFTSTALPGETFKGKVVFVDPVLDPKTMTAGVRAVASNDEGRLRPDMFVGGEISVPLRADGRTFKPGSGKQAGDPLVIPATAPLLTGKRAVVYVRLPDTVEPVFEGREVVLGPRAGESYVVLSGLEEGEQVVTSGAFKLDSEMQIRAKRSMMDPGAGEAQPVRMPAEGPDNERPFGHITTGSVALRELGPVYGAYFDVQMALARDDHAKAVAAYKDLVKKTEAVDMTLFKRPAHGIWMDISAKMKKYAAEGAESKDIKAARDSFYHLSKAVIELQERIGHPGGDFFLTFCPMARDNAGAFWIQEVDTVYNSFYGAAMLRCGSIEKRLPAVGGE